MIKQNKGKLLLTSLIILLPMLVGVCLWNTLPDQLAIHWGGNGAADGFGHKALAVFGLPLFMLAAHWLCMVVTAADAQNRHQNRKVLGMVLWICPVLSVFAGGVVYAAAWGFEWNMESFMPALLGLMFAVLGNYLPKCKQNHTIGIKLPWTLASEEIWNKTHRLCGKWWVVGGLVLMASIFLPTTVAAVVVIVVLVVLAALPVVYAYRLYRKQA